MTEKAIRYVKSAVRWVRVFPRFLRIAPYAKRSIVALTVAKSGTNLLKFLLCNYLRVRQQGATSPVSYDDMHCRAFFVDRQILGEDSNCDFRKPLNPLPGHTNYRYYIHTHNEKIARELAKRDRLRCRYILQYRNPLDTMISSYFYHYRHRRGSENEFPKPAHYMETWCRRWCGTYRVQEWIKERQGDNALRVSYEDLFRDQRRTFTTVLAFLGIEIDERALKGAMDFSTLDVVRQQEADRGKPIHSGPEFFGSFVRDGSVGQWKRFLDRDDVRRFAVILDEYGLDLDSYTLE